MTSTKNSTHDTNRKEASPPLKVLIVEDTPDDALLITRELKRQHGPVEVLVTARREEVVAALERESFDLVLTDHSMPGLSSLDVLELTRDHCPCIIVSGAVGEETAVDLLQRGAADYVNKNNLQRLGPASRRAIADAQNRKARQRAEEELRRAHAELERRVEERTAALQQSYRRLRQEMEDRRRAEAALRDARLKLTRLREDERLHLSREIHDGVVQDLLGITYAMAETERSLRSGLAPREAASLVQRHRADLQTAVRQLRNLIKGLRPPGLDEFGLKSALDEFTDSLGTSYPDVVFHTVLEPADATLPPAVAQSFFRIAQEAVRNALRHGQPQRIRIRVTMTGRDACLEVSDDGRGFRAPDRLGELARDDHFGLVLMDEHAQLIGGTFELVTAPGRGTTIRVRAPLASAAHTTPTTQVTTFPRRKMGNREGRGES